MPGLMPDPIRLGTRASILARTQSATVGDALAAVAGRPWAEVLIRTHGDDTSRPLASVGRPGVFVSALRDALVAGDVDVIVHSYKDLPSAPHAGLVLAAVPPRADPRDGLVAREGATLAELPAGSVVGTSSPRRAAALALQRPDLVVRPIRGNVDSRIAKVRSGEYDAAVLAVAGLTRIGRADEIAEVLDLLPAPAQGALAVECRVDDVELRGWLAQLEDPVARLTTQAEREVLVGVDATCTTAIASAASWDGSVLRLRAELTDEDGHRTADVRTALTPAEDRLLVARALGLRAAGVLRGARDDRPPVLLVRAAGDDADAVALAALGIPAISDPYVEQAVGAAGDDVEQLCELLARPATGTWLVVTSPVAVRALAAAVGEDRLAAAAAAAIAAGVRAAATGERTAQSLRDLGFGDVRVPAPGHSSAAGLLDLLADEPAGTALLPRGGQALRTLPDGLADRGWQVRTAVVYDTRTVRERPGSALLLESGDVGALVLRAPSAVHALVHHARPDVSVRVVVAGPTTAAAADEAGLRVDAVAASSDSATVAAAVAALLNR